jgi:hypothetical protein
MPQQVRFYNYVHKRRGLIEALVAYYVGVRSPTRCYTADVDDWMHGSFNLCIPVTIENFKRVFIRFSLPYRVGDNFYLGNCWISWQQAEWWKLEVFSELDAGYDSNE